MYKYKISSTISLIQIHYLTQLSHLTNERAHAWRQDAAYETLHQSQVELMLLLSRFIAGEGVQPGEKERLN